MSTALVYPALSRVPRRRATIVLGASGAGVALVGGFLAGQIAGTARVFPAIIVAALVLALVAWRQPIVGLGFLLLAATLIEQFPIVGDGTDQIPLFVSLSSALGLGGAYVTPIEILLPGFVLISIMHAILRKEPIVRRSSMVIALVALMAIVLLAEVRGLTQGGTVVDSLWELRPWLYLFLTFFVSASIIRDPRTLNIVLWLFVIGTGLKGLQGTVRYFQLRNVVPRPEAILAHEEAFFFGLFIILTLALWLFGIRIRLRAWSTALLPFVVLADLGNTRRTAWLIVGVGTVLLFVVAWIRLPERRRLFARIGVVVLAVGLVYFPLFWNSYGALGQPARAFRSAIAPSARDKQSDQYRTLEDANLAVNIKSSAPLGKGFGVPIDYVIPIVDLSNITSLIKFVPHDGLLYVWMRLGVLGAVLFWWLIAVAFYAAGRLLRVRDLRVSLFGALVICALAAYLIQGNYDYGLYWFRMAIFMGVLLGAVQGILQNLPPPLRGEHSFPRCAGEGQGGGPNFGVGGSQNLPPPLRGEHSLPRRAGEGQGGGPNFGVGGS